VIAFTSFTILTISKTWSTLHQWPYPKRDQLMVGCCGFIDVSNKFLEIQQTKWRHQWYKQRPINHSRYISSTNNLFIISIFIKKLPKKLDLCDNVISNTTRSRERLYKLYSINYIESVTAFIGFTTLAVSKTRPAHRPYTDIHG